MFSFFSSRKFLRHIAFLTAAAAAAGMLSGCGGNASDGEPVSIEIWHYYNGSLQSSFDKKIENFNNT
ncbi:MAG: ABC transporter substrate-binding protein, partial [Ruminococcus sp.]|nr:ABC transporter substrate-binding protein [Ruminococcus sp.]